MILLGAIVALCVAAAMEPWARVLHGDVWHRGLWFIHKSHHEPRTGRFERNDLMAVLHAPVAVALIAGGLQLESATARAIVVGVGAGMTLFGIAYAIVHDGLVHGRLPVSFLLRWRFFRRIRGAHLVHHRKGAAPYGLFLGPQELKQRREAGTPRGSHPSEAA